MPEGPEVRAQAIKLNKILANKRVIKIYTIREENKLKNLNFTLKNSIVKIDWVKNKGKYIYFQLSTIKDGVRKVKYIGNHLRLSGIWKTESSKHTIATIEYMENDEAKKIYFEDVMRLGEFDIFNIKEMKEKLKKIGPDVFDKSFDKKTFMERISKYQKSKRKISVIITDQKIMSGIGNYLRADILYLAGISPNRSTNSLKPEDLEKLYFSIKKICAKSLKQTLTRIDGYNFLIYEKEVDPKGNPVEKTRIEGRTVYWVPKVQK